MSVQRDDSPILDTSCDDSTPVIDALLRRVARGDHQAFAALYDHAASAVFGLIHSIVADSIQSETLSAEIWLDLWRAAPEFVVAHTDAMAWVLTRAHRQAVASLRSGTAGISSPPVEVRASRATSVLGPGVEPASTAPPDSAAIAGLSTLTPTQRDTLLLGYFGGLTCDQIGHLLGLPPATVAVRIRDGLIHLRDSAASSDVR